MDKLERKKLHEQGIWVTKDLRQVPVAQMETSWLLNVAKQMVATAKKQSNWEFQNDILSAYAAMDTLNGDMAQYLAESEAAYMEQEGEPRQWQFYLWDEPFYRPLAEEIRKRGETKTLENIKYPDKETGYERYIEDSLWEDYIKEKIYE